MPLTRQTTLPTISGRESFDILVSKLSRYIANAVEVPASFEELRTVKYGTLLRPVVKQLSDDIKHHLTIAALLALKGHYAVAEVLDDRGISATRSRACEIIAWRFVARLSDRDAVEYLCAELSSTPRKAKYNHDIQSEEHHEESPLLENGEHTLQDSLVMEDETIDENDIFFATEYQGLNALEIAVVTESKTFLSQKAIQRILDGIWKGDIVFWTSLNPDSIKEARFYDSKQSDAFCRLRVPMYLKTFEVLFFAALLFFYYHVLVTKPVFSVSAMEIGLYIWLAAFTYNEIGEFFDAGLNLYAADFWSLWDILIIANGLAFFITRMIGLAHNDRGIIDTAYDILSLEALFLVPRICSVLSLHPYFGTLLPCLKEMTKDFMKFLGLIAILYLGFNTCFAFLARGTYSFSKMSYILVKVFFGSSYLGFDVAEQISPVLGPPLMIVFVCLTNILLITSLISLLSNSLSRVIQHAREEYLFVYAVYVLEASTSNRLTYYIPPLNLIPLLLRPLRLALSAERLRKIRIWLLKALHWPLVACIIGYEQGRSILRDRMKASSSLVTLSEDSNSPPAILRRPLSARLGSSRGIKTVQASERSREILDLSHIPPMGNETIHTLEKLIASLEQQRNTIQTLLDRERSKAGSGPT